MLIPEVCNDDGLVDDGGHLEVVDVLGRFADGVPASLESEDRDFVYVRPAVCERGGTGETVGDESGDGKAGVADCGLDEGVVEDGTGTGDEGFHWGFNKPVIAGPVFGGSGNCTPQHF